MVAVFNDQPTKILKLNHPLIGDEANVKCLKLLCPCWRKRRQAFTPKLYHFSCNSLPLSGQIRLVGSCLASRVVCKGWAPLPTERPRALKYFQLT